MKTRTLNLPNYEEQTTFANDFYIAEQFATTENVQPIQDTFDNAFKSWKNNYIYLTELAIVTNVLCWHFYEQGNQVWSKLYSDMYYKVRAYALDNLKGDEFRYYFEKTD